MGERSSSDVPPLAEAVSCVDWLATLEPLLEASKSEDVDAEASCAWLVSEFELSEPLAEPDMDPDVEPLAAYEPPLVSVDCGASALASGDCCESVRENVESPCCRSCRSCCCAELVLAVFVESAREPDRPNEPDPADAFAVSAEEVFPELAALESAVSVDRLPVASTFAALWPFCVDAVWLEATEVLRL